MHLKKIVNVNDVENNVFLISNKESILGVRLRSFWFLDML